MSNRFEEVRAKIGEFLDRWPEAEYGPAHIVLSDYNLEDHWIDSCLESFDLGSYLEYETPPSNAEVDETVAFLKSLKDIPENDRCPEYGDDWERIG